MKKAILLLVFVVLCGRAHADALVHSGTLVHWGRATFVTEAADGKPWTFVLDDKTQVDGQQARGRAVVVVYEWVAGKPMARKVTFSGSPTVAGTVLAWTPRTFIVQGATGKPWTFVNSATTRYPSGHPRPGTRVTVWYEMKGKKPYALRVDYK